MEVMQTNLIVLTIAELSPDTTSYIILVSFCITLKILNFQHIWLGRSHIKFFPQATLKNRIGNTGNMGSYIHTGQGSPGTEEQQLPFSEMCALALLLYLSWISSVLSHKILICKSSLSLISEASHFPLWFNFKLIF